MPYVLSANYQILKEYYRKRDINAVFPQIFKNYYKYCLNR